MRTDARLRRFSSGRGGAPAAAFLAGWLLAPSLSDARPGVAVGQIVGNQAFASGNWAASEASRLSRVAVLPGTDRGAVGQQAEERPDESGTPVASTEPAAQTPDPDEAEPVAIEPAPQDSSTAEDPVDHPAVPDPMAGGDTPTSLEPALSWFWIAAATIVAAILAVVVAVFLFRRRAGAGRESPETPAPPACWVGSRETLPGSGIRHGEGQSQGARETQEDDLGFIAGSTLDPLGEHSVVVVTDGMGGHTAGEVASRVAVRGFMQAYGTRGSARDRLRSGLDRANASIGEAVQGNAALEGMGTTLVAAAVTADGLHWISVGDSPLFLYRDGSLERLNDDHSMRPVIAAMRTRDPDLAAGYNPNELRSVLMGEPIAKIDVSRRARPLRGGDIILVATDGLETIDDEETVRAFEEHRGEGPEAMCGAVLRAVEAKQHPRQDNTTIAVLELQGSRENARAHPADGAGGAQEPAKTEDAATVAEPGNAATVKSDSAAAEPDSAAAEPDSAATVKPDSEDVKGTPETSEVELQPDAESATGTDRESGDNGTDQDPAA